MPCGRRTSRRVVSGGREPLRLGQQACGEPSPEGRGGLRGGRDLMPHVSGDEARGSERSGRRDVDFCHTPGLQRNSSFQSGLSARRMLGCALGLPRGGGGAPAAGHGRGPQSPSRCPLGRILPQTRRLVWGFLSQNLALYSPTFPLQHTVGSPRTLGSGPGAGSRRSPAFVAPGPGAPVSI